MRIQADKHGRKTYSSLPTKNIFTAFIIVTSIDFCVHFRSSSEWYTVSAVQRSQLREIEDNGEFWMPWSEYWKIFTDLTVCSITPDYDSDGISDGLGKLSLDQSSLKQL